MDWNTLPKDNLEKEYIDHIFFEQIKEFIDFYDLLSTSVMSFTNEGISSILNFDTHIFMSISGTLDSINQVLKNGRINDAYALLRKYYDSTIINIYTNLYLKNHFSLENLIVEHIEKWLTGKEKIPTYRIMSKYIEDSEKLRQVTDLFRKDSSFKEIRERCNDNMHYNYYHNLILNNNQMHLNNRVAILSRFQKDLITIFIQHFSYLFYLNEYYMRSSDYEDFSDMGMTPPDNSQYWVAPYVQNIFDKYIKVFRPDIATILKNTEMELT